MNKNDPLMFIDTKQDGDFKTNNQKTFYKEFKEEEDKNKIYLQKLNRLERFIETKRKIICEFILSDEVIEGELISRTDTEITIKTFNEEVVIDPKKIQEINILKV